MEGISWRELETVLTRAKGLIELGVKETNSWPSIQATGRSGLSVITQ